MGGLIIVVLWPMVLPVAILQFLGFALPLIAPILLGLNIAGLTGLLLVRWLWKRSGAMGRAYIDAQPGWKRPPRRVWGWFLGVCMAGGPLRAAFSGPYLIWGT